MAIFVTFGDKLGYAFFTAQMIRDHAGKLPCKIKALEGFSTREILAPKMQFRP
jgi:hypothetical protein